MRWLAEAVLWLDECLLGHRSYRVCLLCCRLEDRYNLIEERYRDDD